MTDAHTAQPGAADSAAGQTHPHVRQHTVVVPDDVDMVTLLGPRDELLRTMERQFPQVQIHVRGNEFTVSGPSAEVALVERLIDELLDVLEGGQPLNRDAVERSIQMLRAQTVERPADVLTMNIVSNRGRTIRPKTLGQKRYVDAIDENTIVFGIGPAGTGKTYLAMAKAVAALQAKQVNRIILTRPAVEAGERLGFLPGTLNDKIDPYLRPLYDALHDMVDPESIPRLLAAGTIEVAPLAYMRGRTLELGVHHPRRGPEHHGRADEDVPHPARLRLEDGRHRRRHPDRPAGWHQRPEGRARHPHRPRRRALRRAHRRRRRAAPAGRGDRRRLRPLGREAADGAAPVSIDVLNETEYRLDELELVACARYVMAQMRVHPKADLCLRLVDEPAMETLHVQWMDLPGPTDVMSFPMDELRPGREGSDPQEGVLGDIVLCPSVAERQAHEAGHATEEELLLLTTHGILHLLGYDHAEAEEEKEMFELQRQLLLTFLATRGRPTA